MLGTSMVGEDDIMGRMVLEKTRRVKDIQMHLVNEFGTLDIPSHVILSCKPKTGFLRCQGMTVKTRSVFPYLDIRYPRK